MSLKQNILRIKIAIVLLLLCAYVVAIPLLTFPQIFNHKSGTATIQNIKLRLQDGDDPSKTLMTRIQNLTLTSKTQINNINISVTDNSKKLSTPTNTIQTQNYKGAYITFFNNPNNTTVFSTDTPNDANYTATAIIPADSSNPDSDNTYKTSCASAVLPDKGPYELNGAFLYVSVVLKVNDTLYYSRLTPNATKYAISATISFDLVNPPIPFKRQIIPIVGLVILTLISIVAFYKLRINIIESSYSYNSIFSVLGDSIQLATILYIFLSLIGFVGGLLILLKNIYVPTVLIDITFVFIPISYIIGMYLFLNILL